MINIKQHEIWQINFDPSLGQEIQKTRPALVLSNSYYNLASGTVFVVPLTSQKPKEKNSPFFVRLDKNKSTNLKKESFANVSQLRSVSKMRFIKKIGDFDSEKKEEVIKKFLEIVDIDILKFRYF